MPKSDLRNTNRLKHWNELLNSVAISRDRGAFQEIFEHFAPLIKAYAYKVSDFAQAEALAEELVQESMIKVWMKSHTFKPTKSSASTWIFTIARNTRIDLLRKSSRHWSNGTPNEEFDETRLSADDLWPDQHNDIADIVSDQTQQENILDSIKQLPEDQITVVSIIFLEGLSHSEAATRLKLPLGTVKSRVRLALQKLKLTIDV